MSRDFLGRLPLAVRALWALQAPVSVRGAASTLWSYGAPFPQALAQALRPSSRASAFTNYRTTYEATKALQSTTKAVGRLAKLPSRGVSSLNTSRLPRRPGWATASRLRGGRTIVNSGRQDRLPVCPEVREAIRQAPSGDAPAVPAAALLRPSDTCGAGRTTKTTGASLPTHLSSSGPIQATLFEGRPHSKGVRMNRFGLSSPSPEAARAACLLHAGHPWADLLKASASLRLGTRSWSSPSSAARDSDLMLRKAPSGLVLWIRSLLKYVSTGLCHSPPAGIRWVRSLRPFALFLLGLLYGPLSTRCRSKKNRCEASSQTDP